METEKERGNVMEKFNSVYSNKYKDSDVGDFFNLLVSVVFWFIVITLVYSLFS